MRSKTEILEGLHKVDVRLVGFGESELKIRAYPCVAKPPDAFDLHTAINLTIKKRFDSEGITIPYPQRVISYRNEKEPESQNPQNRPQQA
jgi:small-conductance mechanosensitive channel